MFKGKLLGKSFKPSKCTTSLKLAVSRIKLLKNKKEALVKQLRREIAHLIEMGQHETAGFQVEHVIREENMMAAYDYIEVYCKFISERMSIIESQKTCPGDLKEAIASVIFASPRCGDILELKDARKHFEAKYGKEFGSAAVNLHPECGVYRPLVGKLSALRPDDLTKQKSLSSIAKEHGIKWDPELYSKERNDPPEDVVVSQDKSPTIVIPIGEKGKQNRTINLLLDSSNSSKSPQQGFTAKIGISVTLNPEPRPSGWGVQGRESEHVETMSGCLSEGADASLEFPDAKSAAEAAAVAAERACQAAKTAVILSQSGNNTNFSPSFSEYARGNDRKVVNREMEGKDEVVESEVSSENEIRFDQESEVGTSEFGESRMIEERAFIRQPSQDDWKPMESYTALLDIGKHKQEFEQVTEGNSASEKTLEQTTWIPVGRGYEEEYKGQMSPWRKLIPFFDSESGDSSDDDDDADNMPGQKGKARIDPSLSRRMKKPNF